MLHSQTILRELEFECLQSLLFGREQDPFEGRKVPAIGRCLGIGGLSTGWFGYG
jgi:hypothetical protein